MSSERRKGDAMVRRRRRSRSFGCLAYSVLLQFLRWRNADSRRDAPYCTRGYSLPAHVKELLPFRLLPLRSEQISGSKSRYPGYAAQSVLLRGGYWVSVSGGLR